LFIKKTFPSFRGGLQAAAESISPLEKNIQFFKTWNIFFLFSFLDAILAFLMIT
jgi:hypothetical protein